MSLSSVQNIPVNGQCKQSHDIKGTDLFLPFVCSFCKFKGYIITFSKYLGSTGMIYSIFTLWNKSTLPIIDWGICVRSCWGKLCRFVLNSRLSIYSQDQKSLYIHLKLVSFVDTKQQATSFSLAGTLIDKCFINENKGKIFCCFTTFKTCVIQHGMTDLLLIKLIRNKIGGRCFWPYLRQVNSDKENFTYSS